MFLRNGHFTSEARATERCLSLHTKGVLQFGQSLWTVSRSQTVCVLKSLILNPS